MNRIVYVGALDRLWYRHCEKADKDVRLNSFEYPIALVGAYDVN